MDAVRTSMAGMTKRVAARGRTAMAALLVAAAIPWLGGCETGGGGASPVFAPAGSVSAATAGSTGSPSAELERAIADHRAGRYDEAAGRAAGLLGRTDGRLRDQAAYVAGVALLEAGRFGESERMLAVARRTGDPALRARAEAASGLALAGNGREQEAMSAFERAWDDLAPGDRGRAVDAALAIADKNGDQLLQRRWSDRRRGVRTSAGSVSSGPSGGPARNWRDAWSVQIGAFSLRSLAETAASRAARRIDTATYGEPRIIPRWSPANRSELLYVVQFGAFDSEADAGAAIRRHGWSEWIVRESAG
jgi:tetratricopeptide (TPR) repeat protein